MNKVFLIGRLTADPELSTTTSGISVCRFRIAVSRNFKTADGVDADFFSVVVWRAQAQNCSTYLRKGSQCCVVGSLQTRQYEKDGEKRYVTEIQADNVEFLGSPSGSGSGGASGGAGGKKSVDELEPLEDDGILPF